MQTWALIKDSFREAIDRKLFWVVLGISLLIALVMACFGFDEKGIVVLFGVRRYEWPELALGSPMRDSVLVTVLAHLVADVFMGWIGVGLALIATAGTFPSLMEKGTIDVLVSKPLRRWHLFAGKYAGGLCFILVHAAVFVVLTFLVAGLRWRIWVWTYFWLIPLFIVLFSYLYCLSVLFGILTRNAMTTALLALGAWVVIWAAQYAHAKTFMSPDARQDDSWSRSVRIAQAVLPKTRDMSFIAGRMVSADVPGSLIGESDALTDQDREQIRRENEAERNLANVPISWSIGSSLAFEAVIVALAGWRFCRRDF